MTASKSIPVTKQRRLLDALYEGEADLADLASQEKITLHELAAWAREPRTMDTLDGLCRLNDVRAQLLISRYRTLAAAQLFALTQVEGQHELARKACVDLLRTSLVEHDPTEVARAAASTAPMTITASNSLRAMLEAIGTSGDGGDADASRRVT